MPTKQKLTPEIRQDMVRYANGLIEKGKLRKDIVDSVTTKYGFSRSSGAALALRCSGVELPPGHKTSGNYSKPSEPVSRDQNNIDTERHPYIPVVNIINRKPGYSASFVNGVIHVNGKPLPPRIAFSIADQKWPIEA